MARPQGCAFFLILKNTIYLGLSLSAPKRGEWDQEDRDGIQQNRRSSRWSPGEVTSAPPKKGWKPIQLLVT
ncbi:MAG: hypothetical protein CMJ78_17270 [Planctomycetaceae bacterium]|nr:hypothetical protein [Planctomycetaceae bacterium]